MRERPKDGGDGEQCEDDDCDQVREEDDRPATAFQRPIRNPNRDKGVHASEGVAEGGILVLSQSLLSV